MLPIAQAEWSDSEMERTLWDRYLDECWPGGLHSPDKKFVPPNGSPLVTLISAFRLPDKQHRHGNDDRYEQVEQVNESSCRQHRFPQVFL